MIFLRHQILIFFLSAEGSLSLFIRYEITSSLKSNLTIIKNVPTNCLTQLLWAVALFLKSTMFQCCTHELGQNKHVAFT